MDKKINEEVQEEAYKIADYILNAIKDRDTITRDEFEEQIALACRELYGIDNVWETMDHEKGLATINGKQFDMNDLDADIRGILSYKGWATDFKDGDLTTKEVKDESVKEDLEFDAMEDLKSEVYNALSKIYAKFKLKGATLNEFDSAVEFVTIHMRDEFADSLKEDKTINEEKIIRIDADKSHVETDDGTLWPTDWYFLHYKVLEDILAQIKDKYGIKDFEECHTWKGRHIFIEFKPEDESKIDVKDFKSFIESCLSKFNGYGAEFKVTFVSKPKGKYGPKNMYLDIHFKNGDSFDKDKFVNELDVDLPESLKEDKEETEVEAEVEAPKEEEPEEEHPIETTVEEVKEIASEVANKVVEPVSNEEDAEEQQEKIEDVVDEVVDDKFGEEEDSDDEDSDDEDEMIVRDNDEVIDLDDIDDDFGFGEDLKEDTVKKDDKWVNKGKEGTHGEFKTKKEADAQRKAMFANGYHEEVEEDFDDDFGGSSDKFVPGKAEEFGITVDWDDMDDDLDDEDAKTFKKVVKNTDDKILDKHFGKDTPERKLVGAIKDIDEEAHETGHIKAKKPIELRARR